MSKNKLIWSIALFLIIIAGLPVAYAQASGGFNWIVLAINAAVIFVVLFALQAFLIPQKSDKERTSVWVIMIIASLLVAFLFGSSGFIWKTGPLSMFFNLYVLGNALLIGIVLYFALGLLKIGNLNSPEGKTGYGILIFLVAVFFAVQLGNQWIWQKEVVRSGIAFLFADGKGILHPKGGLFVFVTGFVLFAFFFENFLLQGAKKVLNYGMALIFAIHLATPPANPMKDIVMLGEVFFVLILQKSLKGTTPNEKVSWLIALFLIGWASTVMTMNSPDNRGLLGSVGCWFVNCKEAGAAAATAGAGGWLWTILKWGLILFLVIFLLFGGGLWAISRGEERHMLKEGWIRIWAKILQKLRQNRVTARIVGDWLELRDPTLPGELPFVFKDLRVEIYTLMNYMLRHEIYKAKARGTYDIVKELGSADKGREKVLVSIIPTPEAINKEMRTRIEGGAIRKTNPEGEWEVELQPGGNVTTIGFARTYYLVFKVMENLKKLLERDLTKKFEGAIGDEKNKIVDTWKENQLKGFTDQIDDYYGKRYIPAVRRFRVVNLIKVKWYYFLDMYNLYGEYKRGYRFAKFDTKPYLYTYRIKPSSQNDVMWEIDWNSVQKAGTATAAPNFEPGTHYLIELDIYGYSTSDINTIQIEKRNLQYIRKWNRSDIGYLHKHYDPKLNLNEIPRFAEVVDLAHKDWEWFIQDIERGIYHPYSKRIDDYTELIAKGYMNFDAATFKSLLTLEQTAFDREGLKNTGRFIYWGRKNYYDETRESLRYEPVNPFPTISMQGLWGFISTVAAKRVKEPEMAKKYLDEIKMGYRDIDIKPGQQGGAGENG